MNQKPIQNNTSLEEVLFAFRKKLSDSLRNEAENLKCPISHIDTLAYIAEKGSPSMKEISNHLKITPPSTTAVIEALQKKKFITRIINTKDRRTIRVELAPPAWKFLKSLHEKKFTIFAKMLSKLSQKDREHFIRILGILTQE